MSIPVNTTQDQQIVNTQGGNNYSLVEGHDGGLSIGDVRDRGIFDYRVEKRPLYNRYGDKVPNAFEMVREDNGFHLANVGSQYTPVQSSALLDVAQTVQTVAKTNGQRFQIEGAGTAHGGRVAYLQMSIPGALSLFNGKDVTNKIMTIFTGHDGQTQLSTFCGAQRVSCANMVAAMAKGFNAVNRFVLRHTSQVEKNLHLLGDMFAEQQVYYRQLGEALTHLTSIDTKDDGVARDYFKDVFNKKDAINVETEEVEEQKFQALDKLMELRESGLGMEIPGVRGTRYGDYQAVTEYLDHHQRRATGTHALSRIVIESNLHRIKSRALDLALN